MKRASGTLVILILILSFGLGIILVSGLASMDRTIADQRVMIESLKEELVKIKSDNQFLNAAIKDATEYEDRLKARIKELEDKDKQEEQVLDNISEETGLSEEVAQLIVSWSENTGGHISLVLALIDSESGFDSKLDHVNEDGTHDRGLFQINDRLDQDLWKGVFGDAKFDKNKMYDPVINTRLGLYHLTNLYRTYNADTHKVLTAYNRGEGGARRWIKRRGTPVTPYSETIISRAGDWERRFTIPNNSHIIVGKN